MCAVPSPLMEVHFLCSLLCWWRLRQTADCLSRDLSASALRSYLRKFLGGGLSVVYHI